MAWLCCPPFAVARTPEYALSLPTLHISVGPQIPLFRHLFKWPDIDIFWIEQFMTFLVVLCAEPQ